MALVIFWGESCWYAYTGVELAELGTSACENVEHQLLVVEELMGW